MVTVLEAWGTALSTRLQTRCAPKADQPLYRWPDPLMAAVLHTTSDWAANSAHYMLTGRTLFRLAGTTSSCVTARLESVWMSRTADLELPLCESN
jgi:hypothetical protein